MASRARTVVTNAASVFASDAFNRATIFIVYALVGRRLGAFEFGQISLALTFFYVFQVLAGAGLKTLVTREVAKDPAATGRYVVNAAAVVVALSAVSLTMLFVLLQALSYSGDTATVVLIVGLGLLPYSIAAVCEGVFQAHERMTFIVAANAPIAVLRVAAAFLLLARGHGLISIVWMLVGLWTAVALVEGALLLTNVTSDLHGFSVTRARELALATLPFLGIEGLVALLSSIDVILLSKLVSVDDAGLYNAANQLTTPMLLVIQSVALSVFPMMCRWFETNVRQLARTAESAMAVLFALALAVVVAVSFVARDLLVLLYRQPEFGDASTVLRIAIWQLAAISITSVLGQVLFAAGKERVNLRIVAIDAVTTVVLGVVLIQQFGMVGAAATALTVKVLDVVLHYIPAVRVVPDLSLAPLLWSPLVAAACFAAALFALGDMGNVVALIIATPLYVAVLVILESWTSGGVHRMSTRYAHLWSE
jgi:O-antigen/teichoic acid export membrane protein